jgi:formate C-acetyltransferase
VLKYGLDALKEDIAERIKELKDSDPESKNKKIFYKATLTVFNTCTDFAQRFSKLASELAAKEPDSKRKAELLKISEVCSRVPAKPANSFYEALQSIWFIHLMLQIESNGHSMSLGRLDRYLYDFFKKDTEKEILDYDEVLELLQCLWIKLFCVNKLRPWSHTRFSPGSPLYQNVTVGGQDPEGNDSTNDLTRLILRSVSMVRLTQPLLVTRIHRKTPDYFLKEIVDVINLGFGMPALINDGPIVEGLIDLGFDKSEALDYTIVGCIEPAIAGKWGYRPTGMSFFNLMKILNLVLTGGYSIDKTIEINRGNGKKFLDYNSFDELMQSLEERIRFFTKAQVELDRVADSTLEENTPDVLCSSLVKDCIKRAKNLFEGGARFDWISGLLVGNANIANALAAIKYLVFDKKTISASELMDALNDNFESEKGQLIRKLIKNKPPKYGNDDDYADLLLKKVFDIYCDEIADYKNLRCGRGPESCGYYAGTSSLTANVAMGSVTEATPDGRRYGEPFAEGCSPAHCDDISGPTAVLKSVSKLPAKKILGGVLLNQKFNPSYIKSENGVMKFIALIKTFFNELNGFHVQYNVVTTEKLRDAQKNPEKYKDLIVRVAGYSALFTQLSPEIQEDIIGRTEQSI